MTRPATDTPMREVSRDSSGACPICTAPLPSTRAHYCSRACQQRGYRLRHQAPTTDFTSLRQQLQRRQALVAHTIYECPRCSERYVADRRCSDCHVFNRALGLGGSCPDCDSPILLADLLETEVMPTT